MSKLYKIACKIQQDKQDNLALAHEVAFWGSFATLAPAFAVYALVGAGAGIILGVAALAIGLALYHKYNDPRKYPKEPTKHLTDCALVSPLVFWIWMVTVWRQMESPTLTTRATVGPS